MYSRKRPMNLEEAASGGEGRAVTLKESDGISYRDETDVVKQGEAFV